MPVPISNDLSIIRLSESKFIISCYKDKEQTIVQPLNGLTLLLVAKTKLADVDGSIVFSLAIGSGLVIDTEVAANNVLKVTISSSNTSALPVAKATTLYCELLYTGANRTTIGQFTIPVLPSVKQT